MSNFYYNSTPLTDLLKSGSSSVTTNFKNSSSVDIGGLFKPDSTGADSSTQTGLFIRNSNLGYYYSSSIINLTSTFLPYYIDNNTAGDYNNVSIPSWCRKIKFILIGGGGGGAGNSNSEGGGGEFLYTVINKVDGVNTLYYHVADAGVGRGYNGVTGGSAQYSSLVYNSNGYYANGSGGSGSGGGGAGGSAGTGSGTDTIRRNGVSGCSGCYGSGAKNGMYNTDYNGKILVHDDLSENYGRGGEADNGTSGHYGYVRIYFCIN